MGIVRLCPKFAMFFPILYCTWYFTSLFKSRTIHLTKSSPGLLELIFQTRNCSNYYILFQNIIIINLIKKSFHLCVFWRHIRVFDFWRPRRDNCSNELFSAKLLHFPYFSLFSSILYMIIICVFCVCLFWVLFLLYTKLFKKIYFGSKC